MNISEYKKTIDHPLKQVTLIFLTKDDEVLLAMKKRGFGEGKFNGVGGKVEDGEMVEQAAYREAKEEIGVSVSSAKNIATLNFYFPSVLDSDWNQQVHVFITDSWLGEPQESEEMKPQWFPKSKLPFEQMWVDDAYWLPLVLDHQYVNAEFMFGKDGEIIDMNINNS